MNTDMKNILEHSMKDIVLEAINDVDIKGIMTKQIQTVTESIARDMFSSYGDFGKELEKKLKNEIQFNIDKISVPNFAEFAIDSVIAELNSMEIENKADVAKRTSQRLRNLLGNSKDIIPCKDIENNFAKTIFDEINYKLDECYCGAEPSIDTFSDLQDLIDERLPDLEISSTLQQTSRNWGSDWNACSSYLVLDAKYDDKSLYNISIHIDRVIDKSANETYQDDDYFVQGRINTYKILSVEINGRDLVKDGTVFLNSISNKLEEILLSSLLNGLSIDMNKHICTDIQSD